VSMGKHRRGGRRSRSERSGRRGDVGPRRLAGRLCWRPRDAGWRYAAPAKLTGPGFLHMSARRPSRLPGVNRRLPACHSSSMVSTGSSRRAPPSARSRRWSGACLERSVDDTADTPRDDRSAYQSLFSAVGRTPVGRSSTPCSPREYSSRSGGVSSIRMERDSVR